MYTMLVDKSGRFLGHVDCRVEILYLPNVLYHQIQAMGHV
jgi:hypothetical protein